MGLAILCPPNAHDTNRTHAVLPMTYFNYCRLGYVLCACVISVLSGPFLGAQRHERYGPFPSSRERYGPYPRELSGNRWSGLDPSFREAVSAALEDARNRGIEVTVSSGFRSQEEQDALRARFESGNTSGLKTMPARVSQHTSQRATDITLADAANAAAWADILLRHDLFMPLLGIPGAGPLDEVHVEAVPGSALAGELGPTTIPTPTRINIFTQYAMLTGSLPLALAEGFMAGQLAEYAFSRRSSSQKVRNGLSGQERASGVRGSSGGTSSRERSSGGSDRSRDADRTGGPGSSDRGDFVDRSHGERQRMAEAQDRDRTMKEQIDKAIDAKEKEPKPRLP